MKVQIRGKIELNQRENEIIVLRFFEGKTQMEVAEMIGISQAQVSRLEKNALNAFSGVGKSSGIVPPIFSIAVLTSLPTL